MDRREPVSLAAELVAAVDASKKAGGAAGFDAETSPGGPLVAWRGPPGEPRRRSCLAPNFFRCRACRGQVRGQVVLSCS